jgi:LPXTG-site transpeptidase (sortase) family protein
MFLIALGIVGGILYYVHDQTSPLPVTDVVLFPTDTPMIKPETTSIPPTMLPTSANEPSVLLIIPKANVGAKVMRLFLDDSGHWDVSQLGNYAGVLQGTAWIDHPGNIVLVGHVELKDGSPGIFAYLRNLEIGDEVLLTETGMTPSVYHVNDVRSVEPDDLSILYPSSKNMLTLITCDNYDFVSNSYLKRIVVTATSVNS